MSHTIYYKIYCVVDTTNGKEYVGVTTRSLHHRLVQHCTSRNDSLLTDAMKAHGVNNFKIRRLGTVRDDKQEAFKAESDFILERGTLEPDGYNRYAIGVKRGSKCGESASKIGNTYAKACQVIQMTRDRQAIRTYPSMKQAAEATGINRTNINSAANGKRPTAGGFVWTKTDKGIELCHTPQL